MNSTRTVATSIHAVLAASILLMLSPCRPCAALGASIYHDQIFGVETEFRILQVLKIVLERDADGAESDLLPRDARFVAERHLERLLAGLEVELDHSREIEQMH